MSDAVSVRLGCADDYAAMCAILDGVHELHVEGAPWLFRKPDAPRSLDDFREFFRGETSAALVADSGQVIGVVLVLLRSTPTVPIFHQQSYGVIDGIGVHPNRRRQGVGRRLASAALHWAESRGAVSIELGVFEFNQSAIEFYEALGFETVSRKYRMPLGGGK